MLTAQERAGVVGEMEIQMVQEGVAAGNLVLQWIGRHAARVVFRPRYDSWARNVLGYCERYGWIEDPALLLVLLNKVAHTPKTAFGPRIPAIVTRITAERPPIFWIAGRAWDTCHLSMNLPFLNRDITRRAFEEFDNPLSHAPHAARVLVVNGPPGSGKTFTADFLRLLVKLRADRQQVIDLDFGTWTGKPLTPDLLVVDLVGKMAEEEARAAAKAQAEQTVPRLVNQRPDRWAKDLAIWLAAEANRTNKTWHIVLDNFHRPGVPPETHLFIKQLAVALAGRPLAWDVLDPDMGPPLRLVLLGYPEFAHDHNGLIRMQQIQPITVDNLKIHFQRYYQYKGWPVVSAEIERIASRYDPRLPSLFPTNPAPVGAEPARWGMDKLAEIVLLDCKKQAQSPAATAAGGSGSG